MITSYNYEGKTEAEVLKKCYEELNVNESEIYKTLTVTEQGLFKNKKYNLKVVTKEDVKKYIKEFFNKIATSMNNQIQTEIRISEDTINIVLMASDNAILIGKEGKNLKAMQDLLRQTLKNQVNASLKVNLDAGSYKEKKVKNLEYLARKTAKEVLNTKVEAKFDPMNSYERRIIHNVVGNFKNLKTISVGEEPNRYVTIKYEEEN